MWARSRRAGSPVQRNVRSRELRSSSDKAILVGMARFPWDVAGSATTHHRTGPLPVQQDPDEPNLAHAFPHAGTYLVVAGDDADEVLQGEAAAVDEPLTPLFPRPPAAGEHVEDAHAPLVQQGGHDPH